MKIVYQKESCSRCNGSGQYSYCQMYGSTCFKCAGSGKQLTRAGKAAKKRIETALEAYNRPVEELEPGMQVRKDGRWFTFQGFEDRPGARWLNRETGEYEDYVTLQFKTFGWSVFPGQIMIIRPTSEQFVNELVPIARKLKGAEVIEGKTNV